MRHAPLLRPARPTTLHPPTRWRLCLPLMLSLASCWVTEGEVRKKIKVDGGIEAEERTGDTGEQ